MRSRYSAYVLGNIDYLIASTLPNQQPRLDQASIRQWSLQSTWLGLEVEHSEPATDAYGHAKVSFSVRWQDAEGVHTHQERSIFVQRQGRWYFIDPGVPFATGRNDPCPCGSGGKFKKCCAAFL